jgi:hypothetical protein
MKAIAEPLNVERRGIKEVIKCGMTVNAHSFRLLAKQYENPILALIRELACNAYDSHTRANKQDVKFIVKLPNSVRPEFVVRDYGVGMSHEVVKSVYSNYMSSDKHHTNDETGYFGIGSKSPLAYADSFNINCYDGNFKRVYSVGYGEDGIPELNLHSTIPCEEPTGVEVRVPVSTSDINSFVSESKSALRYFENPPKVYGLNDGEIALDTIYSHKNVSICKSGNKYDTKIVFVMGNIGYSVDKYKYFILNDNSYRPAMLQYGVDLVIKVPIGSFSITPSRDSIEFNNTTTKNLELITNECLITLEEIVKNEVELADKDGCLYTIAKSDQKLLYCFNKIYLENIIVGRKIGNHLDLFQSKTIDIEKNGRYHIDYIFNSNNTKNRPRKKCVYLEDVINGNVKIFIKNSVGALSSVKAAAEKNPNTVYVLLGSDNPEYTKWELLNYFECLGKTDYKAFSSACQSSERYYQGYLGSPQFIDDASTTPIEDLTRLLSIFKDNYSYRFFSCVHMNNCSLEDRDSYQLRGVHFCKEIISKIHNAISFSSELPKIKRASAKRSRNNNSCESFYFTNLARYSNLNSSITGKKNLTIQSDKKYYYVPVAKSKVLIDNDLLQEAVCLKSILVLLNDQLKNNCLDDYEDRLITLNTLQVKEFKNSKNIVCVTDILKKSKEIKEIVWGRIKELVEAQIQSYTHSIAIPQQTKYFIEKFEISNYKYLSDIYEEPSNGWYHLKNNNVLQYLIYHFFKKEVNAIGKDYVAVLEEKMDRVFSKYSKLFYKEMLEPQSEICDSLKFKPKFSLSVRDFEVIIKNIITEQGI